VLALVRIRVYREYLTTIDAGGLRLLEGARIQIADIDSGRMLLPVHGKGTRDRDGVTCMSPFRLAAYPGAGAFLDRPALPHGSPTQPRRGDAGRRTPSEHADSELERWIRCCK